MFTRVFIHWSLFVRCLFWTEDRWTKIADQQKYDTGEAS